VFDVELGEFLINNKKEHVSEKAKLFTESVIREMTRLCSMYNGVNLAQGFPDFAAPEELKEAAVRSIRDDYNQYSITWGSRNLRKAIAEKASAFNQIPGIDSEKNIVVTCGSTEAMVASLMATTNPGEEVIVFEPFYENYGPDAIISGAKPRFVSLKPPVCDFDEEELKKAFNKNTSAIIVNTPHNPTGKVFTEKMLKTIADLCQDYDALAITDEIYEHIIYGGRKHISIASLDSMEDRTVTISGASKTYSVTGWRVGYAIASAKLTNAIKKIHDFLTVGSPHPLQEAAAVALNLPESYYVWLKGFYDLKRKFLLSALSEIGFDCVDPEGAYYIWTDVSKFGAIDDVSFSMYLVKDIGVATVPGSSFYSNAELGRKNIRFTFSKKDETLKKAVEKFAALKATVPPKHAISV
jgi:aminotransferase